MVQVRSFASQKVYVTGEVVRPGIIGLPGEMTLIAAIGEAGGIKPTGNVKSVVLIRKGPDDRPEARKIVLRDGNKLTADAGLLLRPYDIVLVPETKIARLDRWVDQHIRQLIPGNMVLGFSYILNNAGGSLVPF
jgi:polysaccharide export outer membrane protein